MGQFVPFLANLQKKIHKFTNSQNSHPQILWRFLDDLAALWVSKIREKMCFFYMKGTPYL
jgi:hypothetical protein